MVLFQESAPGKPYLNTYDVLEFASIPAGSAGAGAPGAPEAAGPEDLEGSESGAELADLEVRLSNPFLSC